MRAILWLPVCVLATTAMAAAAPAHHTRTERNPAPKAFQLGGSVILQERPLPGTVLYYPGLMSPPRGRHGGLLA